MIYKIAVLVLLGCDVLGNVFFEVIEFSVGDENVCDGSIAFHSHTQYFDLPDWVTIALVAEDFAPAKILGLTVFVACVIGLYRWMLQRSEGARR